jgi:biopolymer transport protein TolR
MLKRTLSQNKLSSDINVTPMADVMLVLLIIFMITTPLLQNEVSLNLPKARYPLDIQVKGPLVLSLTREGKIYLGKTGVTEQQMKEALSDLLGAEINKTIFLRADQSLAYGNVVHFVNECRRLRVKRIGLMAEKEVQPY